MAEENYKSELYPCPFCGLPPKVYKAPKARGTKEEGFITECEVYTVACKSKLCNVQPETREYTQRERAIEVWNERLAEAGMLFPPCKIGDTLHYVDTEYIDGTPFMESYKVGGLLWDGEKWYATEDNTTFNEIGTNEAIIDKNEAIEKFVALSKKTGGNYGIYIKN